jgi:hypothetical protein
MALLLLAAPGVFCVLAGLLKMQESLLLALPASLVCGVGAGVMFAGLQKRAPKPTPGLLVANCILSVAGSLVLCFAGCATGPR